jgi:molybdopterin-guanine dinucleotide biosynthesis protein B
VVDVLFPDRDVVVVEGAKKTPLARIWVGGPETLPENVPGVLAYYGGEEEPSDGHPLFRRGQEKELLDLVESLWKKAEPGGVTVMIRGRRVPVKDFVADFISGGIEGMLRALKGVEGLEDGFSVFCRGRGSGGIDG